MSGRPGVARARLILVRHGESVANAELRFTRGPHEPLSGRGRAEARERARVLVERFAVGAVYASPFARALETARIIATGIGHAPGAVRVVEELREQSFGDLRGQPYPALSANPYRGDAGAWEERPPAGETLREVAGRAGPALDALAARHPGEDVLVVSHGGVMAALRGHAGERFDGPPVLTANASGYVLEWHPVEGYGAPVAFDAGPERPPVSW